MFHLAAEGEAGLLIVAVGMTILIYRKFIRSGIPRFRVILLCILCSGIWIMSFILSFLDADPAHFLLWETMSLIGMAATLFVIFIAFFEIMQTPGF